MAKKRTKRFEDGGDVGVQDYASLGKRMPKDKPSEDVGTYDYASLGKRAPKMEFKAAKDSEANAQKDGEDKAPSQAGGDKTPSFKAEPGRGKADEVLPIPRQVVRKPKPKVVDEDDSTGEARTEKIGKEYLELKSQKAKLAAPQVTHAPASKPARTSKEEIAEIVKRTPLKNPSGGFNFMNALRRNQEVGGATMKESARQSRVDRLRRNVGKNQETYGMKKGGKVSSASSRGDGIAQRGKTKGRIC